MILKFSPDWKKEMFGRELSGLIGDLNLLKLDAPVVKKAIEDLDSEIYSGINERRLHSASQISTTALNSLTPVQRQRVLDSIVGRYYEHEKSQCQYKVVIDSNDGELRLVAENISKKYLHIDRNE